MRDVALGAKRATSSSMSGPLDENQALAAIILWQSGYFDTLEIAKTLRVKEDAICRTLHATRSLLKETRK